MSDQADNVKHLMAGVSRVLAEPDSVLRDTSVREPPLYSIDFARPSRGRAINANLDLLLGSWEIPGVAEPTAGAGLKGRLALFVKKTVRRLTDWYMNPLVHDVRRFNMLVTRALTEISADLEQVRARLDELERARQPRGEQKRSDGD